MLKNIKNVIISPIFIIQILISLTVIIVYSINYKNNIRDYETQYDVTSYEDVSKYDEEIEDLYHLLDIMESQDKDSPEMEKHIKDTIKIYESLKEDNKDYSKVYDYGYENANDSLSYMLSVKEIMIIILLFNIISIIYLSFTREFDNHRFVFIYDDKRIKTVLKKIATSLILLSACFIVYYILYVVCANMFESNFKYVLIVEDKARFINVSEFKFNCIFAYILYVTIFLFMLSWTIVLFLRKSIISGLVIAGIALIYILLRSFKVDIFSYFGLVINFNDIRYNFVNVFRLFILLPLLSSIGGLIYFDKSDL